MSARLDLVLQKFPDHEGGIHLLAARDGGAGTPLFAHSPAKTGDATCRLAAAEARETHGLAP